MCTYKPLDLLIGVIPTGQGFGACPTGTGTGNLYRRPQAVER